MGKASSRKGAQGEREAKALLAGLFPWLADKIDRKLGAGRKEDTGDIWGLPGFTVQVANRTDLGQTLGDKAEESRQQQQNAQSPFGVMLMKLPPRPGGKPARWRFVLTPEQFGEIYEALRVGDE